MPAMEREIKAVHAADLGPILEKFGQRREFEQGLMKCIVCAGAVSAGAVSSLRFIDGRAALTCNGAACYAEVVRSVLG